MADKSGTQSAPATIGGLPRIRDPQFREVYSNASFTGLSPFDITLTLSNPVTLLVS